MILKIQGLNNDQVLRDKIISFPKYYMKMPKLYDELQENH